jgi:hypothetical protein
MHWTFTFNCESVFALKITVTGFHTNRFISCEGKTFTRKQYHVVHSGISKLPISAFRVDTATG